MLAFLRLIRLPNLFIIAFTQYVIRLLLVKPILAITGMELQMSEWEFALLVLSTILISAGGYIINDYFDVRIDSINKPEQLIIGKDVKRRIAIGVHAVLSFLGIAIGIFISWRSDILLSGSVLFTVTVISLWFYSTTFKYQFLIGNLIISFLSGMVPFMVALFEIPRIIVKYNTQLMQQHDMDIAVINTILIWVGSYAAAAFLLSLVREMIKDMEDVRGDEQYGCRTIPIVLGIKKAKMIASILLLFFSLSIAYIQFTQYKSNDYISLLYFFIAIQLPLVILLFLLFKANEKKHFHTASMFVKMIMLTGLCFLLFYRFILTK